MPDLPDPDALRREGEALRRETIARGLRILELEPLLDEVQAKLRELLASFERLGEGDTGSASGNGS